jgi:hypothetical protein
LITRDDAETRKGARDMGIERRNVAAGQVTPLLAMFGGPDAALGESLGAYGRHDVGSATALGG